jgi:hypothetical protein
MALSFVTSPPPLAIVVIDTRRYQPPDLDPIPLDRIKVWIF